MRDLAAEDLARGGAGGAEPDSAVVVIHTPVALLDRWASEAEREQAPNPTIDGGPIAHDTLRRIVCDVRLGASIDTPDGRTVGVGRTTRNPRSWVRRRVIGRDHGRCRGSAQLTAGARCEAPSGNMPISEPARLTAAERHVGERHADMRSPQRTSARNLCPLTTAYRL